MKNRTSLIAFALLVSLFTGCSRQPAEGSNKFTDLGVVKASNGVPSRHVLADGRVCVITPTFLNDSKAKLSMAVKWTNSPGAIVNCRSLETRIAVDETTLLSMDNDTIISLTLHESK
jgi:hypothetical protein